MSAGPTDGRFRFECWLCKATNLIAVSVAAPFSEDEYLGPCPEHPSTEYSPAAGEYCPACEEADRQALDDAFADHDDDLEWS